jgi:hypothetical protein
MPKVLEEEGLKFGPGRVRPRYPIYCTVNGVLSLYIQKYNSKLNENVGTKEE